MVRVFLLQNFTIFATMNKLASILFIFIAYTVSQVFTFYQLQGHLWNKWIKEHPFTMSLLGVPIGYFVILASRQMVILFHGQTWPNRIIGFVLGVFVFTVMAWFFLKEPITTKTIVCLFLCFSILAIQLFWK